MRPTELNSISLPKFEFDTKYFMSNTLSELGMPTAFLGSADFSGITGRKDLFISEVIHQAYVKVNEEGTEAAAATAVVMELSMAPMNVFNANHPFMFIIQEKDSGNILFLGRVVDPRG
jgi:serpin B